MKPLRLLDIALTIAVAFFALGTVLGIATTPMTIGSGGVGINAVVDSQAGVEARRALVKEVPFKIERSQLKVNVHVPKDDRDTRVIMAGSLLVAIALAWVGLLSLRGVVRSAKDGNPFDVRNVNRLRALGGVLLAFPVVVWLSNRLIEGTFDSEILRASVARVDALPVVVTALAVFALAEVFREGTALRELEQTTI